MTAPAEVLSPWSGESFAGTRGAVWELLAETAEDAPMLVYGAECVACAESCRWDDDPRPVQAWSIEHTRTYPSHRRYLLTSQKPGRVAPVQRAAEHTVPSQQTNRPSGPHSHARPRPTRPRRLTGRVLAAVGRYAGVLFIMGLSGACGLVVGTALATRGVG